MPRKSDAAPAQEREPQQPLKQNLELEQHVVGVLGKLENLFRVQVRPLWKDHYRVNVFVGADAASARIAQSYFLVTDGTGAVLECTPKMQ